MMRAFRRTMTPLAALALLAAAGTSSAQRSAFPTFDGNGFRYGDSVAYGAFGSNSQPTPWGDGDGFGNGAEIDNLRLTALDTTLFGFVGGNIAVGETAMVIAVRRTDGPSLTYFDGVDGGNGFFQKDAAGPGLGGSTLPAFSHLLMVRKPTASTMEIAFVDAVAETAPVWTVVGGDSTLFDLGGSFAFVSLNNSNTGGVTESGASSPESVATGVEFGLSSDAFAGGLGPIGSQPIEVFAFMTSYDGELGSNQSVPGSTLVGTPEDPDYGAALLGPVASLVRPAATSFVRISSPTDELNLTYPEGAPGASFALDILNQGPVATQLLSYPSVPGATISGPPLPLELPPFSLQELIITTNTSISGVTEFLPTDFPLSSGVFEHPSVIRTTVLEGPDGVADDAGYALIGASAGLHSSAPGGMKELYAKYDTTSLWLAATGALQTNESIIIFIDGEGVAGCPAGTPLPGAFFSPSVTNQIAGTILDHEVDYAIRATRNGASTIGFSIQRYDGNQTAFESGYTDSSPADGSTTFVDGGAAMYGFQPVADIGTVTDEGFEIRLSRHLFGIESTARVSAVMTTTGAYTWSSDVIPPVFQQGAGDFGHSPDLRLLAGHQAVQVFGPAEPEIDLASGSRGFLEGSTFTIPRASIASAGTVRTMSVLNGGTAPLTLDSVTLTGDPAFAIEGLGSLPAAIPPGGNFDFDVRLSGATPGQYAATLTFLSDDADESSRTLILAGTLADSNPDIAMEVLAAPLADGATHDFGLLQDQMRSRTRTFTVTSIGGLPLNVSGIALADGASYAVSNISPALPAVLAPDDTLTFDVTLDDSAVGRFEDTVTVATNDPGTPAFAVELRGQVAGSRTPLYGTAQVDGDIEGDDLPYGYPLESQRLRTGFGNGAGSLIGGAGSELDDLYVTNDDEYLYVCMPGNLESNGNTVMLFVDRVADTTGASALLPAMPGLSGTPFSSFGHVDDTPLPDGINVDIALAMKLKFVGGQVQTTFYTGDVADATGGGSVVSHGPLPLDAAIQAPGSGFAWAIDGRNTAGVEFGSGFTAAPPFTATRGMEFRIPFSAIEGLAGAIERGEEIRMFAAIDNEFASFWSNQFLPSLDIAAGNLASSTDLSSAGVNLRVARHRILAPPEPLPAGADQTVAIEVAPGLSFEAQQFDITEPGTLYVVRHLDDENRAGLDPADLIDEHWSIVASDGLEFATARLVFPYDEANLGGVPESTITTVYKVEGPDLVATYPVAALDTTANTITVDVTGPTFSDWYFGGSGPAAAASWHLYN